MTELEDPCAMAETPDLEIGPLYIPSDRQAVLGGKGDRLLLLGLLIGKESKGFGLDDLLGRREHFEVVWKMMSM